MNAIERLREYAEATRWGGVCRILHAHHGDFEGDCLERECNECRAAYLRAVADGADAELRDMNARLMPEGMSWPRYTDGSLVEIGDEVVGSDYGERINVDAVKFHANGFTLCGKGGFKKRYECDDLFERLAKVLDADGVEVEVGDDLYTVDGMLKFHVSAIDKKIGRIATEAMFALGKWADPKTYTHRAPVLAADGKPLREGETVYVLGFGEPLTVKGFADDGRVLMSFHDENSLGYKPSRLTHEQPDSWQRIEDDAKKNACEVFHPGEEECDGCRFEGEGNCEEELRLELVKRCKALAERS